MVYHDGKEATKGHYVTEVRHEAACGWLRYDDSQVRSVPDSQLFKYSLPRMPYLLLYRRADTFSTTSSSSTPRSAADAKSQGAKNKSDRSA